MAKVKRFGVLSFAKLHMVLGAIFGLVLGAMYSFGGLVIDLLVTLGGITSQETTGLGYGTVLAFGAIVGMPVIFAVGGLIVGFIGAICYNFFAKLLGGMQVQFEE